MKRVLASILCLALAVAMAPINLIAAGRTFQTSQICGVATADGKPIPNITVRLRNVDTNALVGTTKANGQGEYLFTGLPAGNYVVEVVTDKGIIIGTLPVNLTAGATKSCNSSVAASAAGIAAAGGLGAVMGGTAAVATGGGLGVGAITAIVVGGSLVATGVVVAKKDASPSR